MTPRRVRQAFRLAKVRRILVDEMWSDNRDIQLAVVNLNSYFKSLPRDLREHALTGGRESSRTVSFHPESRRV